MCAAKQPDCDQENCSRHSEASSKRSIWRRRMGQVRDRKVLIGTHWVLTVLHLGSPGSAFCHSNVETQNSPGKTEVSDLSLPSASCVYICHLLTFMFSFPAGEGLSLLTDEISLESFTFKSFMRCHCIHVSTRQGTSQKGVAGMLLFIDCRQRHTVLGEPVNVWGQDHSLNKL